VVQIQQRQSMNKKEQLLVELKVITQEQYDACKKEAIQTKKSLAQCLVTHNITTYESIARAYAEYTSVPFVEKITDAMADLKMLSLVPLSFLRMHKIIPVTIDGVITILSSNPTNFQPLDDVNVLLEGTAIYAAAAEDIIIAAINKYYPLHGTQQVLEELQQDEPEQVAFEPIEQEDILSMESEAPVIKLVNNILFQSVKMGASDIHIEPFEKDVRVRYRVDGIMHDVMSPPKRIQDALTSRIKIMSHLNIAEKRIPQDGRIAIKVADKPFDIRVSLLPVSYGERIVMRLLDKSRTSASIDQMGLSQRDFNILERNIARPNGILYVTGPTGSGKTTTLYSILTEINRPDVNIITVEDPVEYQMKGIGQVQVREKVGLTFATALRSILRQDPDVIMIGETRDAETAQIAIQAALTGHLVLSTLHTNNAPASITRLIDMGVEPFLIASSVVMVMAQRLVRRLCPLCKKKYTPDTELLARIGLDVKRAKKIEFYQAIGCEKCGSTGYKGRLAIFEIMEMTPKITRLTMQQVDTGQLRVQAQKDGMSLLIEDGIRKIEEGITSIEEVLSVATIEHETVE